MGLLDTEINAGYDVPFFKVWIQARNQNYSPLFGSGQSLQVGSGLGIASIFDKSDPFFKDNFISLTIIEDAKAPAELQINFKDTANGIMDQGLVEGSRIWVSIGWLKTNELGIGMIEDARLKFTGVMQRPSVEFGEDGFITFQIKARALTDKMRYGVKTKTFRVGTRYSVIMQVVSPYLVDVLDGVAIMFSSALTPVSPANPVLQTNESDLAFLYRLARRWGCICDMRPMKSGKMMLFFVDNDDDGACLAGSMNMVMTGDLGNVYKMDWYSGLRNLKSLKISGEASAKGSAAGVVQRGSGGEQQIVPMKVSTVPDDDPSNWELDTMKVEQYMRQKGLTNITEASAQIYDLAFNSARKDYLTMFFKKRQTTTSPSPNAVDANLGGMGYKADFELTRGDTQLTVNMPVELGGAIYKRFSSNQVAKVTTTIALPSVTPLTFRASDKVYWRTDKVIHTLTTDGYFTKGTLVR